MSWIKVINYKDATGRLKKLYDRIKGPNGHIDHVLSIHSLRPHTLEGHMALYKSVLHHSGNDLPKWYLEMLGTYVSKLNHCDYCETHHAVGFKNALNDNDTYGLIRNAMQSGQFDTVLDEKQLAGINYAIKLTQNHSNITKNDIQNLRDKGFSDGEILEINQVVSYFNYVNRMVVGLGIDLENKEDIGHSPKSSNSDDWSHQ